MVVALLPPEPDPSDPQPEDPPCDACHHPMSIHFEEGCEGCDLYGGPCA